MNELHVAMAINDLVKGTPGARRQWEVLDMDDELDFLTRRFDSSLGPLIVNVVTLAPLRKLLSVNAFFEATGWCLDFDFTGQPRHSLMRYELGSLRRLGSWSAPGRPPGMDTRQWELAAVLRMGFYAALKLV